ncbi:MAG TPA: hypothetical protein VFN61_04485 [Acidimicrobiales bacterium]|nr:hypothetical protein [Acidimicrobiales bacterium]
MDSVDALAPARAVLAELPAPHLVALNRELSRRALPGRGAPPRDVTIAVVKGGIWLDVYGKAGVLFSADEWARFAASALAALGHLLPVDTPPKMAPKDAPAPDEAPTHNID